MQSLPTHSEPLYVGLDTHLRSSTYHILDARGVTVKSDTVRGHPSKVADVLRAQAKGRAMMVCFEASLGYGPLHDSLASFAQRVVVAHPGDLRLIFRSKQKNDRVDAKKLATLLLLDQVPAVHVPEVGVRGWRELIEFRRRKVDAQTVIKNQLRALLRGQSIPVPKEVGGSRGLWTGKGLAWLEEVELAGVTARVRREVMLGDLAHARTSVKTVTDQLNKIARDHPAVRLLMTIPGVGPRTAEAFVAYVDDPHRFARTKRIGSFLGLTPLQDASGGMNRLGHITKRGPATMRKRLVEAAWQCIRRDEGMRAVFDRITAGKKERRKIALIAIAHKLARIMLAMFKTGETWDPTRLAPALEELKAQAPPQEEPPPPSPPGAAA